MTDPTDIHAAIPWEAVTGLGTLALVLVTTWISLWTQGTKSHDSILSKMDTMQKSAEEGRSRLHKKIDDVVVDLRKEFVSKEVHEQTIRRVDSIDERLNRACEEVRNRRNQSSTTRP